MIPMERNTIINPQRQFVGIIAVALLLAVFLVIARPAIGGAQDTVSPRIHFVQMMNERLLDTRGGEKPGDGWAATVQIPESAGRIVDVQVNVQVVQAAGDGWVEVGGQSAVVHDGGRANAAMSVQPGAGGMLDVKVHGAGTHVIVDLVQVVVEDFGPVGEDTPPFEAGS